MNENREQTPGEGLRFSGSEAAGEAHEMTWSSGKELRGLALENSIFANGSQSAGHDQISRCISTALRMLARRQALHDATSISVDFVFDLPGEWVAYESSLADALNKVVAFESSTANELLAKFGCLDALLDTFGPEDARVDRMKEALLQECRTWLQRHRDPATSSSSTLNRQTSPLSPLGSLFSGSVRSGSRRSQA